MSESYNNGIRCLTVLSLIFVVLKLIGNIDWSWWLVLLPFYGGIVFTLFLLLLVIIAQVRENK